MTSRNTKTAPGGRAPESGIDSRSNEESTPNHNQQPDRVQHRTRPEADRLYAALSTRVRTTPLCPWCGSSVDVPTGADPGDLLRCDCDQKALASVFREWGAIVHRATGGPFAASVDEGVVLIRSGGRPVAEIRTAERLATVAPSEPQLARHLDACDLAVREGEVLA